MSMIPKIVYMTIQQHQFIAKKMKEWKTNASKVIRRIIDKEAASENTGSDKR